MEYVESVAEGMQLYPPEHYLMGKHLFMKYDEKVTTFTLILSCVWCLCNECIHPSRWLIWDHPPLGYFLQLYG